MDHFSNLPNHSRVWIYAANRKLTLSEVETADLFLQQFSARWTAHDMLLHAHAKVMHGFFLIFMVDESVAEISGCGIDKSVQLVKELQEKLGVGFFDRLNTYLFTNEEVTCYTQNELEASLSENLINKEELFFDNLVQTKATFQSEWLKPLSECWAYKRWLSKVQVA